MSSKRAFAGFAAIFAVGIWGAFACTSAGSSGSKGALAGGGLYGSDLAPAGSYFGAKKGNEALHILYSYDDGSVVVVNHTQTAEAALSASVRVLDLGSSDWFHTPTKTFADYSALSTLAPATVTAKLASAPGGGTVTLTNSGTSIAFFTRLKLTAGKGGAMVLPVLWQDNCVSLIPGESRTLSVSYAAADLGAAMPAVEVSGWNVATQTLGG